MTAQSANLLAGDIGGTKTTLAIFSGESGLHTPLFEKTFPSADYGSLDEIIQEFRATVTVPVSQACFGVAGPVVQGRASITNLPWKMTEEALAARCGFSRVFLLNDLVSIANAVPILNADDVLTLNEGKPVDGGAIAVIAPGTGLGEAYLTWDGSAYHAFASEGGHTDFAPTNDLEMDLLRYLCKKFTRVSYERVCSGIGMPNIYAFLKDTGVATEPAWLAERMAATDDPNPVIVQSALEQPGDCPICAETLRLFVSILGAEAGNMALKVLAAGGVYLGGGIPPRILPLLKSEAFLTAFRNKGRFSAMLKEFPIHVILNPKSALFGAARYGLAH